MYPSVTDWPSENWFERDTISTNDRLGVSQAVDIASTFTFSACGISVMEPLDIDCEPVVEVAEVEYAAVPAPYPNPFGDVINLPSASVWTLMDITGKVVHGHQHQHIHCDGRAASWLHLLRSRTPSAPDLPDDQE